jgi:hypothetical protein
MSNKRMNTVSQAIPGTPMQQMWHVLNFHEERLMQMAQYIHKMETKEHAQSDSSNKPTETEQMIQYNTLLQQVSELSDRVRALEADKGKTPSTNMVSLDITENSTGVLSEL